MPTSSSSFSPSVSSSSTVKRLDNVSASTASSSCCPGIASSASSSSSSSSWALDKIPVYEPYAKRILPSSSSTASHRRSSSPLNTSPITTTSSSSSSVAVSLASSSTSYGATLGSSAISCIPSAGGGTPSDFLAASAFLPGRKHRFTKLREFGMGQITKHNVGQLRKLNLSTFPIHYGENFYRDITKQLQYSRFGYLGDVMVGAICCRVEDAATYNLSLNKNIDSIRFSDSAAVSSPVSPDSSSDCLSSKGGNSRSKKRDVNLTQKGTGSSSGATGTCKQQDQAEGSGGKKLYIKTISVLTPYRRFGIASELLAYILDLASQEAVAANPSPSSFSGSAFGSSDGIGGKGKSKGEAPSSGSGKGVGSMVSSPTALSDTGGGTLALSNKLSECYLHVWTANKAAIEFYRRFGFEVKCTIDNYYDELDPPSAVVIACSLPWTLECMMVESNREGEGGACGAGGIVEPPERFYGGREDSTNSAEERMMIEERLEGDEVEANGQKGGGGGGILGRKGSAEVVYGDKERSSGDRCSSRGGGSGSRQTAAEQAGGGKKTMGEKDYDFTVHNAPLQ